jgi:hypothetical protein
MVIALWVLLIHVIEIVAIGVFLLIRRNNVLEKAVIEQQEYIEAIGILASDSEARIKELDKLGAFEADDEVGVFFTNLREMQALVSQYTRRQK